MTLVMLLKALVVEVQGLSYRALNSDSVVAMSTGPQPHGRHGYGARAALSSQHHQGSRIAQRA